MKTNVLLGRFLPKEFGHLIRRLNLISFLIISFTASYSASIEKTEHSATIIGKSVKYLEDLTNLYTWKDALNDSLKFQNDNSDIFTRIASNKTYWMYFEVRNLTQKELWVDVANSNLSSIKFYKFSHDLQLLDSVVTGALFPKDTRVHSSLTFRFPLAESGDDRVYKYLISVKTSLPCEIPLFIGSDEELTTNRNLYNYLSMFFIGGISMILLYNLFLYTVTKDNIYLYYVAYLFPGIFVATYASNFPIAEYIFGLEITHNYTATWFWPVFVFTGLFITKYLQLKDHYPVLHKILLVELSLFPLFGFFNLFIDQVYLSNAYQLVIILFYTTSLTIGYLLLRQGVDRAKLFCIGWSGLIIGTLMLLAVYNGLLPHNPVFRNGAYLGTLFEVLIFSIALGRIINELRLKQGRMNESLVSKNEELVQLNESIDSFNYHVSHDLKSVLNNTIGMARMIEKYNRKQDQTKVAEITEKLAAIAVRGVDTVQSFLSLGKMDKIAKSNERQTLDVDKAIHSILDLNEMNEKIKVTVDSSALKEMHINTKEFDSIFLNFFTNSIKYSKKSPKAEIRFFLDNEEQVIVYQDNGIGINLDKFGDDLFMPFKRIKNGLKTEGHGVGLYLVKRIIQGHGGQIQVSSALEKGTRFEIRIPAHQAPST